MWRFMTCAKQTHTFFIYIPLEPKFGVTTLGKTVQCAHSEIVHATGECVYITGPPARPLGPVTMDAPGASAWPNVSVYVANFTGVGVCSPHPDGHREFCKYQPDSRVASDWLLTEQAHGGVRQV